MPAKLKHPCNQPGCSVLTRERYCPAHTHEATRYDRERGTAAERGYGGRWRKVRKSYLAAHPLCVECLGAGRTAASDQVDHIVPVTGPDDPLFWDKDNWQALCTPCHRAKSARERVR